MTKIKDLVEKYGNIEVDEVELEKILKPIKRVKTIYNIENGTMYYYITERGTCDWAIWDNDDFDFKTLAIGNVFLTREDCEFEIEYLKVRTELKRYASMCKEPIDWSSKQAKYYVYYDYYCGKVDISHVWNCIDCGIHFSDEEVLKQAIKEIGAERIIKYYLGVKGEN